MYNCTIYNVQFENAMPARRGDYHNRNAAQASNCTL